MLTSGFPAFQSRNGFLVSDKDLVKNIFTQSFELKLKKVKKNFFRVIGNRELFLMLGDTYSVLLCFPHSIL